MDNKIWIWAAAAPLLLPACGDSGSSTTTTDTATSTDPGTSSDSDPTADPTDTGTSDPSGPSGTDTDSGTTGGQICDPGSAQACACPDGGEGEQICEADGMAYGPCVCDDPTTGTTDATTDPTGELCEDEGEVNDEQEDAVDLGEQLCDGEPGLAAGALDGDADADWFVFHGNEPGGLFGCGQSDPQVTLTLAASGGLRLCAFAECDTGLTNVSCPNAIDEEIAPGLQDGCCANKSFAFTVGCTGLDNNATVWLSLDGGDANACVDYEVEYTYSAM